MTEQAGHRAPAAQRGWALPYFIGFALLLASGAVLGVGAFGGFSFTFAWVSMVLSTVAALLALGGVLARRR